MRASVLGCVFMAYLPLAANCLCVFRHPAGLYASKLILTMALPSPERMEELQPLVVCVCVADQAALCNQGMLLIVAAHNLNLIHVSTLHSTD